MVEIDLSLQQTKGGACVFSDILERVRRDGREWCVEKQKMKKASATEAKESSKMMLQFLTEGRQQFSPMDGCSFCLMHDQLCPVHPGYVFIAAARGTLIDHVAMMNRMREGEVEEARRRLHRLLKEKLMSLKPVPEPWWKKIAA
eukprot:3673976-Karenia_brevis.AAC.1